MRTVQIHHQPHHHHEEEPLPDDLPTEPLADTGEADEVLEHIDETLQENVD